MNSPSAPDFVFEKNSDKLSQGIAGLEVLYTHLRELLDVSELNIWEWDLETNKVIDFGHLDSLATGIGNKETIGNIEHFSNRLHPEDRELIINKIASSLANQEDYFADFRIQFIEGNYEWISARGRYIYNSYNKPVKMIGTWRLITEDKKNQELVRLQQKTLNRLSRSYFLGEITSSLAHEISQPLFALNTYLSGNIWHLKQGDIEKNTLIDVLEKAVEQTESIGNIIKRIKRFVTHGELHFEPVNIALLVINTIKVAKYYSNFSGMIQYNFDENLKEISIDRNHIKQVFLNLINNAFEAMHEAQTKNPILSIKLAPFDKGIKATIIDNGPGIPQNVLDNLFTPYLTTKEYGFGIGLTLCHKIIAAHGGEIKIERNITGQGTLCCFKLPQHLKEQNCA